MTKFALPGFSARKLRAVLTALAIMLGVAMVSGTFVLTDSITDAIDTIFTDVQEPDAVITREDRVRPDAGETGRPTRRSTSRSCRR